MKKIQLIAFLLFLATVMHAQTIKKADEHYIKVLASSTGKIYDNAEVKFTIKESIKIGDVDIPTFTNFYTVAKFKDGRIYFTINKLKVKDQIYDVSLAIVGNDFNEGLAITKTEKFLELTGDEEFLFKVIELQKQGN
jgi:hypothetical protein